MRIIPNRKQRSRRQNIRHLTSQDGVLYAYLEPMPGELRNSNLSRICRDEAERMAGRENTERLRSAAKQNGWAALMNIDGQIGQPNKVSGDC